MTDQITTSIAQAKVLVMQGLAGKSPRVSDTTGHWEVYDIDTQAWVDTGLVAGLPPVTAADNGKVLKVVNGKWAAVAE